MNWYKRNDAQLIKIKVRKKVPVLNGYNMGEGEKKKRLITNKQ